MWKRAAKDLRKYPEVVVTGIDAAGRGAWVFVASSYRPNSPMNLLRGTRVAAREYLERRELPRPKLNYAVIHRLFEEAARVEDP